MRRFVRKRIAGFTLIEVVVVIVVIGILASIGAVAYRSITRGVAVSQASSLLEVVGQAQNSNYQSRGAFVGHTDTSGASLSDEQRAELDARVNSAMLEVTRGEGSFVSGSTTPAVGTVSVAVLPEDRPAGITVASYGLATVSETGQCILYAAYAPDALIPPFQTELDLDTPGLVCNGDTALDYLDDAGNSGDTEPPAPPTGLLASPGTNSVTLTWTPVDGVSYGVYRCSGSCSDPSEFAYINSGSSTGRFTDSGLTAGSRYSYFVTAANSAGPSAPSNIVEAVPTDASNTPPSRPSNVVARTSLDCPTLSGTTPVCVTLTWDAVSTAVKYRVYRDGVLLATLDDADTDGDGASFSTSYTDNGEGGAPTRPGAPALGAVYSYRVDAVNAGGASSVYPGVKVTTPPAAPSIAGAVPLSSDAPGCTVPTCVSVSWTPTASTATGASEAKVTGYRILAMPGMSVVGNAPATATSFTLGGLPASSSGSWAVAAVNAGGVSAPSGTASVTSTALAAPTNLRATPAANSVALSWTAPAGDVTGYEVYRVEGVDKRVRVGGTEGATEITVERLAGSTEYTFVVAAKGPLGVGAPSAPVRTTTQIGAVVDFEATVVTPTSVQFRWTAARSVTYSVVDADTNAVVATGIRTGTYLVGALTPATRYSFKLVSAANGVEASTPPLEVVTLPEPPANLAATASGTDVTLSWSPSSGTVSQYRVLRCGVAPGQTCTPTQSVTDTQNTSYADTGLSAGRTYFYAVVALNATGGGSAPATAGPVATVPTAVSNLVAASRPNDVRLTWDASPAAQTYQVYRRAGLNPPTAADVVGVVPASATEYTDSSAAQGVLYSYTVVAANTAGVSATATAVTGGIGPDAVRALKADATEFAVTLSWVHDSNTSRYDVYRCAGADCTTFTLLGSTPATGNQTYVDSTVDPLLQYSYRVIAVANNLSSEPTTLRNTLVPLAAPAGLTATANTVSASATSAGVTLTWTKPTAATSRATSYRLYNVTDPANPVLVATINNPSATATVNTTSVTGLATGTLYKFRAASVFGGREGPLSVASDAEPAAVVTTNFPTPSTPTTRDYTTTSLTIGWNVPPSVTRANVYMCTATTCNDTTSTLVSASNTTGVHTMSGLNPNTTYRFYIKWVSDSGNLSGLSTVLATNTAPLPTVAPRVRSVGLSTVTVEWDRVTTTGTRGYALYRNGLPVAWYRGTGGTVTVSNPATQPAVQTFTDNSRNLLPDDVAATTSVTSSTSGFTAGPGVTATSVARSTQDLVDEPWFTPRYLTLNYNNASTPLTRLTEATSLRVTPGTAYTFSSFVEVPSGSGASVRAGIEFLDASGAVVGSETLGATANVSTTPSARIVTATAPDGAVRARVFLSRGATSNVTATIATKMWQLEEGTIAANAVRWTPGKLVQGQAYNYTLALTGGSATTSPSLRVSAPSPEVVAVMPPGPPTSVSLTTKYRGMRITFPSVPAASGYAVYRCEGVCEPSFTTPTFTIPASGTGTVTFDDSGLLDYTQYSYAFASVTVSGTGEAGETVTGRTLNGPAEAPTFTGVGSTSLEVNWVAPPGATFFQLYRVGTATPLYTGGATSFLDSGLNAGTTYGYYVVAGTEADGGTFADPSPTASVTTRPPAPTLVSSSVTTTTATLTWAPAPTATSYRVREGNGAWVDTTELTYTFPGLVSGTQYSFSIAAVNEAGASNPLTVALTTNPDAPLNVAATTGNGRGEIDVTWSPVRGAARYTVYSVSNLATNGSFETAPIGTSSSQWNPGTSTAGTTRVKAQDEGITAISGEYVGKTVGASAGSGVYSLPATTTSPTRVSAWVYSKTGFSGTTGAYLFVRGAAGPLPTAGTVVRTDVPADTWTNISFTYPGTGVTQVRVVVPSGTYIDDLQISAVDSQPVPGCTNVTNATSCLVSGLADGTAYSFSVTANTQAGGGPATESVRSNVVSATTRIAPPSNLQATASSTTVNLTWDTTTGATTYDIQRCQGATCTDFVSVGTVANVAGDTQSTQQTGLATNTTYRFQVAANTSAGKSAPSTPATADTIPAPPQNLNVQWSNTNGGQATLSWSLPASGTTTATSYQVWKCTTTASICVPTAADVAATGLATLTWQDTAVELGKGYGYTVVAVNTAGTAADTVNYVSPPAAPTSITFLSSTARSVTVRYTPSPTLTPNTSYTVYRCLAQGFDPDAGTASPTCTPNQVILTNQTLTATDNTAKPGATYRYAVAAANAGGTGPRSTATVDARTKPEAPTGITASPGATTITLNWTAPAYNPSYQLAYCEGIGCDLATGTTISLPVGQTQYVLGDPNATPPTSPLRRGTQYTIGVASVDTGSVSTYASILGVTGMDRPANITTTASYTPLSMRVTWSAVESATSYEVARCVGECGNSDTFTPVGTSTTLTFDDSTIARGLTYTWRVRGLNSVTTGPYSNTASSAVAAEPGSVNGTFPLTPTGLRADSVTTTSVTLSWNPVPGAASYIISRPSAADVTVTGATSRQISGLAAGGVYQFTVRAANAYGASTESDPALQVVTAPVPPTSLSVTSYQGLVTTFGWDPSVGNAIVGYQLSIDDGVTWLDRTTSTSATLALPAAWTTYPVRVRSVADLPSGDGTVRQVSEASPVLSWRTPHGPPTLTAIESTDTGITLTIAPPSTGNPDSYTIYRCSSNTACTPDTAVGTVNFSGPQTTWTDTLLGSNKRYFYSAAAVTTAPARISAPSAPLNAWTAILAPEVVVTAQDTNPDSPSSANISWVTTEEELSTSFVTVQVSSDGGATWTTYPRSIGEVELVIPGTSMPASTEYWVQAVRTNSVSGRSSPLSAVVKFTSAPPAPTTVTVASATTAGTPPKSTIGLNWNSVAGATAYRAWLNGTLDPVVLKEGGPTAVSNLAPATDYQVRLSAQNTDGFRSAGSFPPLSATTAPGIPDLAGGIPTTTSTSGPLSSTAPNTTLAVNTDFVPGVTSYDFTIDGAPATPTSQYTATTGDRVVFEFANLACGSTFTVTAAAKRFSTASAAATTTWKTKPCAPIINSFSPTVDTLQSPYFSVPTQLVFNTPSGSATNPGRGATSSCVQTRQGSNSFPANCASGSSESLASSTPQGGGFAYTGVLLASGTQYGVRVLSSNEAGPTASAAYTTGSGAAIPGEFTVQTVTSELTAVPSATNTGSLGSVTWRVQGPASTAFYNSFLVAQTFVSNGAAIASQNPAAPPTTVNVLAPTGTGVFTTASTQYAVAARPCLNFFPSGSTYASGISTVCGRPTQVALIVPDFACPSGFTRTAGTDFCTAPATSCNSGFYRDFDRCISTSTAACPSGTSLSNGTCVGATATCSAGSGRQTTAGATSGVSIGFCVTNASFFCTVGSMETNGFKCFIDATRNPVCRSGYSGAANDCSVTACSGSPSYFPETKTVFVNKICGNVTNADCGAGWTRTGCSGSSNPRTVQCERPQWRCDNGTLKSSNTTCFEGPISCSFSCPGGWWGPTPANRCNRQASASCPSGFSLSSPSDPQNFAPQCQRNEAPCPLGGTVNSTYTTCDRGSPCGAGTTYNSTTLRCEYGSLACPGGGNFNGSVCSSYKQLCPVPGSSYNSTYQHCRL